MKFSFIGDSIVKSVFLERYTYSPPNIYHVLTAADADYVYFPNSNSETLFVTYLIDF